MEVIWAGLEGMVMGKVMQAGVREEQEQGNIAVGSGNMKGSKA